MKRVDNFLAVDERGNLTRSIPAGFAYIPADISLCDNRILWNAHTIIPIDSPPKNLLETFIQLADPKTTADDFLGFAKKNGILGLCSHGHPGTPLTNSAAHTGCRPLGVRGIELKGWEPIEAWRVFAEQARSILQAAPLVIDGQTVDPETMRSINRQVIIRGTRIKIYQDCIRVPNPRIEKNQSQRIIISSVINHWLHSSKPYPTLVWSKSIGPKYEFENNFGGLFWYIALQVLLAVCQSGSFAQCHGCKQQYPIQDRRPRSGERSYCRDCKLKKVSNRDAQQDFRDRKKFAIENFLEGVSIVAIADQLRFRKKKNYRNNPKTVKGWIIEEIQKHGFTKDATKHFSEIKLRNILQAHSRKRK